MATQKQLNDYNVAVRELALLRATKPGKDKYGKVIYVIDGTEYTQYGFDNLVKKKQSQVDDLKNIISPSQVTEANRAALAAEARKQAEQLSDELVKIRESVKQFKSALARAGTSTERALLERWLRVYTNKENEFNRAVESLANDSPMVKLPDPPKYVTVNDAKGMTLQEPDVPTSQPFVPGQGQGIFGEPLPTTPVGGVAPTPGVVYGGMPSGAPMETAPETPEPEIPTSDIQPETDIRTDIVTQPGTVPSFTDPATGVTYQPGEMIGGEDRALPNGGGVVNGIYIPPGIDYAWLGQQVPEDWEAAAKELYGAYYEMIKQYPELGSLIKNAIQQGWSDDKFQYQLEQTNWWKTTSANTRSWETLLIQDPASAQVQLDNRTALLRDTAQRLGITLTSESLARIAEDSIKLGLELTSQLEDIVGSEALRSVGTVSQLRYGYVGNSIRESARKYGVALSDTTFNEWVNKIAVGAESTETFESYAQQIARTLYPSLNNGFDRGLSFAQMTDPYAQVASRILEIPGAQVDFTNPKWAQAFTMKDDKGNPMQMSFGEWADYLRTDPSFGWEYTDDAKNRAYTVVNRLAELFGAA